MSVKDWFLGGPCRRRMTDDEVRDTWRGRRYRFGYSFGARRPGSPPPVPPRGGGGVGFADRRPEWKRCVDGECDRDGWWQR